MACVVQYLDFMGLGKDEDGGAPGKNKRWGEILGRN
jgi:hypothetical protein